jgi:hypothetical protein
LNDIQPYHARAYLTVFVCLFLLVLLHSAIHTIA